MYPEILPLKYPSQYTLTLSILAHIALKFVLLCNNGMNYSVILLYNHFKIYVLTFLGSKISFLI